MWCESIAWSKYYCYYRFYHSWGGMSKLPLLLIGRPLLGLRAETPQDLGEFSLCYYPPPLPPLFFFFGGGGLYICIFPCPKWAFPWGNSGCFLRAEPAAVVWCYVVWTGASCAGPSSVAMASVHTHVCGTWDPAFCLIQETRRSAHFPCWSRWWSPLLLLLLLD